MIKRLQGGANKMIKPFTLTPTTPPDITAYNEIFVTSPSLSHPPSPPSQRQWKGDSLRTDFPSTV